MAYSYKEYTSASAVDGGRTYTYTFDAVDKNTTNIKVTIGGKHLYDGVTEYDISTRLPGSGSTPVTEYTVSSGSITILASNAAGAVTFNVGDDTVTAGVPTLSSSIPLRIFRQTNRTTAEVSFASGSILSDSDLNKANNQARFLGLEAVDRANESMAIDSDDSTQYDIQVSGTDKRIYGVEDPENSNDAASKAYVDGVAMGSGVNIATLTGTQELTNKTITSPVINTGVSGTGVKDEDDMSSNSATHLVTQQSVKAYVDATNELVEDTTPQLGGMLDVNGQSIGDGTLELLKFSETGSAVNEITIANAATGNNPTIQATGEVDTGIDFENSEGEEILILDAIASAVNEITIANAATGNAPTLSATGGDDNIDITLTPKGTGLVSMTGDLKVGGNDIQDSGGVVALTFDGSGNTDMADKILQRPTIKDYAETGNAIGVTGSAETIDITSGNVITATLDDNCTFTFSNPSASGSCCSFTLILTQDGTGSRTVTWPGSVQWASATAPTLSAGGGDVDIFAFITVDAGAIWYGFTAGLDMDI